MSLPEISVSQSRLIFKDPVGCSRNWQGLLFCLCLSFLSFREIQ